MTEILLDTSALVEFFDGTAQGAIVCEAIEEGIAAISVLSIAELSSIFAKRKKEPKEQFAFIYRNVDVLPISASMCERAGAFKITQIARGRKTSLIDAIIYCVAQEHNLTLLTRDKDFAGLEGVKIL